MLATELIPAAKSNSRRLMVVLHGLGDSMMGYQWLPMTLRLDGLNYLLVNAPDPYYGGFSWYDFMGDTLAGVTRSRQLLFQLLDEQRKQGFPTEETVLFGFSQGCLMTLEVGCRYGYRFAGLMGISGYVFEPEKLVRELAATARQQRFLVTHGTFDPLIPIAQVRPQIQLLKAQGLQIDWHEFAKEHTIAGDAELAVIRKFIVASYPD
jgi:phospholipase/carboxylesterase